MVSLNWNVIKQELLLIKTNTLIGKLFADLLADVENEVLSLEALDKSRNTVSAIVVPVAPPASVVQPVEVEDPSLLKH